MAAALTLMAKERGDVRARPAGAVLPGHRRRPSTPTPTTSSPTGYFLRRDGMQWFWDQYTTDPRPSAPRSPPRRCAPPPSSSPACRRRWSSPARPTCCATRARRTPNKLREAGVPVTAVRYQGIIHDFVMLNALRDTHAAEAAIAQAISVPQPRRSKPPSRPERKRWPVKQRAGRPFRPWRSGRVCAGRWSHRGHRATACPRNLESATIGARDRLPDAPRVVPTLIRS